MFLYLSVLTVILIYYYCTRTFNYWNSKNVKGPKPIPFFGNYKDVALRNKHVGMLYSDLYKQYPEEKVIGLYRMTSPTLLIRDLDIVKQVMNKDFPSFPDRATYYSKEGLSENIFHADLETWKSLRNKFTTVFTTSKLKNLFHMFIDLGEKFTDYMEDVTLKESEQDVYRQVLKYTAGTTMAVVFGLNIDSFNDDNKLFEVIDDKLRTNHLNELDMLLPGSLVKLNLSLIHEKTIKFCHEIVKTVFNQMPAAKINPSNVMDVIINMKLKQDIDNKDEFIEITDAFLTAQAWIFFTAGYANNTLALSFALYHLARNCDVQNKLIEEIDEILEKYENKLTYDAMKEMKYLDMVFQETLRMHPPTNGLIRSVAQNVKLEGIDLTVDAGTVVVVSPYSIHHDEKYYLEPERFIPERFSPENVKGQHPCSFLSFGVGRRSCLGSQLAKLQFGIGLAKILSKFRVETTKNTVNEIKYDPWRLLLTPHEKIRLEFIRR